MTQSREAGARWLQVAVMPGNARATAFYEAMGFTPSGERPIYAPHGEAGGPPVAPVRCNVSGTRSTLSIRTFEKPDYLCVMLLLLVLSCSREHCIRATALSGADPASGQSPKPPKLKLDAPA